MSRVHITQKLKNFAVLLLMVTSLVSGMVFLAPSSSASAASCAKVTGIMSTANTCCLNESGILTFPTWYRGAYTNVMKSGGTPECVLFPNNSKDELSKVWVVVSNVVEILIQAVGYAAVGFIIYGGFKYITSQGEAAGITAAKDTITRAIVGLVISIVSVLILNLVVGVFGLRTTGGTYEIEKSPTPTPSTTPPSTTPPGGVSP